MAVSHTVMFFVGLGGLWLGLVLHMVGTGTRSWVTRESDEKDPFHYDYDYPNKFGLFSSCTDYRCTFYYFENAPDVLLAVISLCLIGIALSALGGIIALMMATCMRFRPPSTRKMLAVAVLTSCLIAGVMIFIGVIVYDVEIRLEWFKDNLEDDFDLGYSFALCIVGAIFIVAGGVLVFVGRNGGAGPQQGDQATCDIPLSTIYHPQTMGVICYQPQQPPRFLPQQKQFVPQQMQVVPQQQQFVPQQLQVVPQQQQVVPQQQQFVPQQLQVVPQQQQVVSQQQQFVPQQLQVVPQQQQFVPQQLQVVPQQQQVVPQQQQFVPQQQQFVRQDQQVESQ